MFIMNPYRFRGDAGNVTAAIDFAPENRVGDPNNFRIKYDSVGNLSQDTVPLDQLRHDSVNDIWYRKLNAGRRVRIATGPEFEINRDSDVTIEFWVGDVLGLSYDRAYISTSDINSLSGRTGWIAFNYARNTHMTVNDVTHNQIFAPGTPATGFSAETPSHIAFTKEGSMFRVFKDGVMFGSADHPTYSPEETNYQPLQFGASPGAEIGKVRITQGVALYTENFTPEIWR